MLKRFVKNFSSINKFKTSINIPSQNINWTREDLSNHITAFKNSLNSLEVKKGDQILFWMDKKHISESIISNLASLDYGLKVDVVNEINDLKSKLESDKYKIMLFSPNELINFNNNKIKKSEFLYELLPELKNNKSNKKLNLNRLKNMNYIVQTGFYKLDGITKFKDIMNYTKRKNNFENNLNSLNKQVEENKKKMNIDNKDVIVIGNPLDNLLFNLGPLNSYINSINTTFINDSDIENSDISFLNQFKESYLVCNNEISDKIKGSFYNENIKIINY